MAPNATAFVLAACSAIVGLAEHVSAELVDGHELVVLPNMLASGANVLVSSTVSVATCAAKCIAEPRCKMFTVASKDDHGVLGALCLVKNGLASLVDIHAIPGIDTRWTAKTFVLNAKDVAIMQTLSMPPMPGTCSEPISNLRLSGKGRMSNYDVGVEVDCVAWCGKESSMAARFQSIHKSSHAAGTTCQCLTAITAANIDKDDSAIVCIAGAQQQPPPPPPRPRRPTHPHPTHGCAPCRIKVDPQVVGLQALPNDSDDSHSHPESVLLDEH